MNETAFQGEGIPCHRRYPQGRENECFEQCKAQSRSKWWGNLPSDLLSQSTSSWNSGPHGWVLEHWPGGALYPPHVQPQQKLENTHRECTRTRNTAMWPECTRASVLFVHLPPKHVKDKSWAKEMNKHGKTYSGLWSKAQGNQDNSSRANHTQYTQLQCIWSSLTRK